MLRRIAELLSIGNIARQEPFLERNYNHTLSFADADLRRNYNAADKKFSRPLDSKLDLFDSSLNDCLSNETFTKSILADVHYSKWLKKIQSLSRGEVGFRDFPRNCEKVKPCRVYIFEVDVFYQEHKLEVTELACIFFSSSSYYMYFLIIFCLQ